MVRAHPLSTTTDGCVFNARLFYFACAGARQLDVAWAPSCAPRSALQLHAAWHVLAAAALWTFWLFLRSERASPGACATTCPPVA
jgi:hypothetical protein